MTRQELINQIRATGSFLCVGLDTDIAKLPDCLKEHEDAVFEFNKAIVDATAPYCVAYKPNSAFYECRGAKGWEELRRTCEYIKTNHPDKLLIVDCKRGDIGNTARMYAKAMFEDLKADAVTVAPYMGSDSISPFLGYEGKWVILLDLTSNPSASDFQLTKDIDGSPLFINVLRTSSQWNGVSPHNMMYVVGATRAEMLADVRKYAPDSFLLVPGVGAQGGSLEEVCRYGLNKDCGLLVNSSRGIIYASMAEDYAHAAAAKAKAMRDVMVQLIN